MIYHSAQQLIGNTPLLYPERFTAGKKLYGKVLVKLECFNPAGSVKDRAAYYMILDAEQRGLLTPGSTIIEPTSGNTGIGLASIASIRGYQTILTMPDSMSAERRAMLAAYGAKLVLTPGSEGMAGAIKKAEQLHQEIPAASSPVSLKTRANARAIMKQLVLNCGGIPKAKSIFLSPELAPRHNYRQPVRYLKEQNP